jgi:hypothetical protein
VRELKRGLWHWEAPHPDWTPSEAWDQAVVVLRDRRRRASPALRPLAVPSEIVELAADREPTDRPALERALA